MPPTGWESGNRNANLTADLIFWNRQAKLGMVFDSSTGFILPNSAVRSPDAAWVRQDRMNALNPDPDGFLPLAPDFVVELRSASDSLRDGKAERLKSLQEKMQEYIDNGVRLGWLLNAKDQTVEIYRANREIEVLSSPLILSGEDVLPGFKLSLIEVF